MEELIQKINELQEICTDISCPVSLPQIAVVGAQSAGKSSVLENILGASFLPRGPGMVTRRPLMLQILPVSDTNSTPTNTNPTPSKLIKCSFGHAPGKVFALEEVEQEIKTETERLLEDKKDVSGIPILLKVQKPGALPLTLIDLPGLVRVRAEGQPDNITEKIEEIVRSYIKSKSTVILAVTPACTDISGSEALVAAKHVDPNFERTLCVLTKTDLMDPGTDLAQTLRGEIVKVKLGFIPVICRGENALSRGVSIPEALAQEREYFSLHPCYKEKTSFCGVPYLVHRLHEVLKESIRRSTPGLQEKIASLIHRAEKEVLGLGDPPADKKQALMQVIAEFKQEAEQRLTGASPGQCIRPQGRELVGGARISYSLDVLFPRHVRELPLIDVTDEEIDTVMMNASGVYGNSSTAGGVSYFVASAVDKIKPHALLASEGALQEMQRIVAGILAGKKVSRFSNLQGAIRASAFSLLQECSSRSADMIKRFLHWNTIYIRSSPETETTTAVAPPYKDYIDAGGVPDALSPLNQPDPPAQKHRTVRALIEKHTKTLRDAVVGQVPKIIVSEVVHEFLLQLQQRLIEDLYRPAQHQELMRESDSVSARREELKKTLSSLRRAQCITRTL